MLALALAGCEGTGGADSSAVGTNSDDLVITSASAGIADATVIEQVATRLAEVNEQWTAEQWLCVATQMAEHTDAAVLRERFLREGPSPGPAWSEAEATSYVDALWACTPQAELSIVIMINIDPSKERCIREAVDFPKIKASFVAGLMGADGSGAEVTGELERVRELCGVPSSRVGSPGEDTIPWPVPEDECTHAKRALIDAVDAWYETHDVTDHPSGPELAEAGLLAEYDTTLFKISEGSGPEQSYVLPTLACAD